MCVCVVYNHADIWSKKEYLPYARREYSYVSFVNYVILVYCLCKFSDSQEIYKDKHHFVLHNGKTERHSPARRQSMAAGKAPVEAPSKEVKKT